MAGEIVVLQSKGDTGTNKNSVNFKPSIHEIFKDPKSSEGILDKIVLDSLNNTPLDDKVFGISTD